MSGEKKELTNLKTGQLRNRKDIINKNKQSLGDWDMNITPAYAKWESQKERREKEIECN